MSSTPVDDVWRPLKRLWMSWLSFFEVLLDPVGIILLGFTLGLIVYETSNSADLQKFPLLAVAVTGLISIFGGITGAYLQKGFSRISEGGVLVTRGKSAIRGLTLLLQNLNNLEGRVASYLSRAHSANADLNITTSYEEVISRCTQLEEEAINSIEEWTDIIPDANVKTQIGVITSLKNDAITFNIRVNELTKQLDESKLRSNEEQVSLRKQLQAERTKLDATTAKLNAAETKLRSSPLSGLSGFEATGTSFFSPGSTLFPHAKAFLDLKLCPYCYTPLRDPQVPTCPSCKKTLPARESEPKDKPK